MKRKTFNIQLFADDEVIENTPTEQVEGTPTTTNAEGEDEPNFEDGSQDDENTEEPKKNEKNQKNDASNTNNANAQKRLELKAKREKEKEERRIAEEQKKREREITLKAYKDATGSLNRFTNEPIEDEDDVEEYKIMLQLEKEGKDPIEDYPKYIKEQRRKERLEEQKKLDEQRSLNEKMEQEKIEFDKLYGDGALEKAFSDEEFIKFAKDMIDEGTTPRTAYKYFLNYKKEKENINNEIEAKAQDLAIEKDARRQASSGSLSGGNMSRPKTINELSDEEFRALQERALQH